MYSYISIYVDDVLIVSSGPDSIMDKSKKTFNIMNDKLDPESYLWLGWIRNHKDGNIKVHTEKYIR